MYAINYLIRHIDLSSDYLEPTDKPQVGQFPPEGMAQKSIVIEYPKGSSIPI
jgi:hypothetical protein